MKCNNQVTIYHQNGLDIATHFEKWDRYNYDNVWFYGYQNSTINEGYSDNNKFDCRIPYDKNSELDISNFSKGDIVIEGHIELDISNQSDLENYIIYNITSIKDNKFGEAKHIHIGGE